MSANPLVSVVVPTYNYGHFLKECLESILAQTYRPIEIVVADDGSDDDTAAIVQSFPSVRYLYQKHEGNGGARALNLAIRESKGDYIAWLSADDLFLPHKLERQVPMLLAYQKHDPRFCLVHSDLIIEAVDSAGLCGCPLSPSDQEIQLATAGRVRWVELPHYADPDRALWAQVTCNTINGCTTLIDRRVLDDLGGFDESMPISADFNMWVKMLAAGYRIAYIPEPLIISRRHGVNTAAWNQCIGADNLTLRKLREQTPLERIFPNLAGPVEEWQSRYPLPANAQEAHLALARCFMTTCAFDAAVEEFNLAQALPTDPELQKAQAGIPTAPLVPIEKADLGTEKRQRVFLIFGRNSDVYRCHQVLRHYLQAFDATDDVALVVWLPPVEEVQEQFQNRFAAVCEGLGLDPESEDSAEVVVVAQPEWVDTLVHLHQVALACDFFLPLGTASDHVLFTVARYAKLRVIYEATVPGFRAALAEARVALG